MKFDLIVIGAGSGLNVAAAARNLKVAMVEEGPLGGTCLNRGCIPSKILIHTADVLQTIKHADKFNIKIDGKITVDFKKIMERSWVVDKEAKDIEENIRKAPNITLFKGRGVFVGPKTLQISETQITADKILIAAGTRPSIPRIEGLDNVPYMTSDELLRVEKLPKKLIIIGGGYIATELAHFFGSMGSEISVLQRPDHLLPDEDEEISREFTKLFSEQYDVHLGFNATKVTKKGNKIIVTSKDGKTVDGTDLLIATGRKPNTDLLHVEKTGVKTNNLGYIETNEYLETNIPGIWALGDIIGKYQFKHSANLESEYAVHNILHSDKKIPVDYTAMPHAIFTYPQIAGVGVTEQELQEKEISYMIGRYNYVDSGMGLAMKEEGSFVKFLVDYEGKILGCHIMGAEASTLIHEVLVSMRRGKANINDILRTVHIHPALSEIVERGAESI
ncbi:dihydrolipoyl dehydrogenase [Candidatus Micrarchaeota archaeon]|nr:dihydrolipoyl dehydrogenase [Candidatus Micrarchaeota archaeon]